MEPNVTYFWSYDFSRFGYFSIFDYSNVRIETRKRTEALNKLDEILDTPNLDGIYIGPADLSLAIGQKPAFDNPEGSPTYEKILNILEHAKKNKIFAGIHNASPEYAKKMLNLGFNLVTIGSDQRYMSAGAKDAVSKLKSIKSKEDSKAY